MQRQRSYLTMAVFGLLALAMADILIDAVGNRANIFKAVAGTVVPISGKLMGSIKPYAQQNAMFDNRIVDPALIDEILVCEPEYPAFRIHFLELKGRLWRAELQADSGAAAGEYPVFIRQRSLPPDPEAPPLQVRIFANEEALHASQTSLFRRYLGLAPWVVAMVLLPAALLLACRAYRGAEGSISALQARGLGPIYKMAYRKTGWEILFGLGSDHGLRNGDVLQLLDARHRPVGCEIVAFHVGPQSGEAVVDPTVKLRPGFVVYRPLPEAGPPRPPGTSRLER
ncbi:MAG TPA: hypothetical protein ENF48_02885 [Desulfobacteraceae bacterium]|nr:hypothetical protein [Deltaproteobacteria bacterium]MBW2355479.1 hypothetical protein [Deltaproteobacteria bacterium]RLB99101.1 MAG: hypothetical protein DRH76_00785 [Deltaproteobacteria bacterium]HDI59296.1 hypothetical protein [Desulfobacteraceae bacterium]